MFPSFIYVLIIAIRKSNLNLTQGLIKVSKTILALLITLIVFNYPSLNEKGKLSFHSKKPASEEVNWTQMQYLAVIGQEKGELKHNTHYSWEQVEEYLKLNGENSLPATFSGSIFFDLKRTIREFFKDFMLLSLPFTRLLGLLFPIGLILFLLNIRKKNFLKNIFLNQIFMFFMIFISIISFIIISNIETRWFVNILILLPLIIINKIPTNYNFKGSKLPIRMILVNLQLLCISIMNIPFILKNFL